MLSSNRKKRFCMSKKLKRKKWFHPQTILKASRQSWRKYVAKMYLRRPPTFLFNSWTHQRIKIVMLPIFKVIPILKIKIFFKNMISFLKSDTTLKLLKIMKNKNKILRNKKFNLKNQRLHSRLKLSHHQQNCLISINLHRIVRKQNKSMKIKLKNKSMRIPNQLKKNLKI